MSGWRRPRGSPWRWCSRAARCPRRRSSRRAAGHRPARAAAGSADRAAGPVRGPGLARRRREAEGRGARGGRIGFDIVQSSLSGRRYCQVCGASRPPNARKLSHPGEIRASFGQRTTSVVSVAVPLVTPSTGLSWSRRMPPGWRVTRTIPPAAASYAARFRSAPPSFLQPPVPHPSNRPIRIRPRSPRCPVTPRPPGRRRCTLRSPRGAAYPPGPLAAPCPTPVVRASGSAASTPSPGTTRWPCC